MRLFIECGKKKKSSQLDHAHHEESVDYGRKEKVHLCGFQSASVSGEDEALRVSLDKFLERSESMGEQVPFTLARNSTAEVKFSGPSYSSLNIMQNFLNC